MKRKEYATAHKELVDVNAILRRSIDELEHRIARLERGMEHLADKVSACITAVANAGTDTPQPEAAPAKKAKNLEKNGKPYTDDEIALAVLMNEQGATHAQVAAVLHRTPHAVQTLLSRHRRGETGGAK
jgi:hypothetical protein